MLSEAAAGSDPRCAENLVVIAAVHFGHVGRWWVPLVPLLLASLVVPGSQAAGRAAHSLPARLSGHGGARRVGPCSCCCSSRETCPANRVSRQWPSRRAT